MGNKNFGGSVGHGGSKAIKGTSQGTGCDPYSRPRPGWGNGAPIPEAGVSTHPQPRPLPARGSAGGGENHRPRVDLPGKHR